MAANQSTIPATEIDFPFGNGNRGSNRDSITSHAGSHDLEAQAPGFDQLFNQHQAQREERE